MRRQPVRRIPGKKGLKPRVIPVPAALCLLAAVLAGVTGCAGLPERPALWSPADVLPSSCSVFISVRVPGNEEMVYAVGGLAGGGDVVQKGLSETEYLYLGLEQEQASMKTYAVGSGSYPQAAARTALAFSSDWRRQKGAYPWYLDEESGIKLSFPVENLFCMTTGDMEGMLKSLSGFTGHLPTEVKESMLSADIFVYIPAFDPALAALFIPGIKTMPAEKLYLQLTREGDVYALELTALSGDEKDARALSSVVRLALLARARGREDFSMTDFLRTVQITADGKTVYLSGVFFEQAELTALAEKMTGKESGM